MPARREANSDTALHVRWPFREAESARNNARRDPRLSVGLAGGRSRGIRRQPAPNHSLPRVDLESRNPSIYVRETKDDEPKRIQLPEMAVSALRPLPGQGHHDYLFPAKPNPRFKKNFKKPHAWDLGKHFRRVARAAAIDDLWIHNLRHFTASTLTAAGVADNIISLLTGHKSRDCAGTGTCVMISNGGQSI
jgi:hypothetical protein